MEIFVHPPQTSEGQAELTRRMAEIHAQYVLHCIEKLTCPVDQKLQLLDAVVETLEQDGPER